MISSFGSRLDKAYSLDCSPQQPARLSDPTGCQPRPSTETSWKCFNRLLAALFAGALIGTAAAQDTLKKVRDSGDHHRAP